MSHQALTNRQTQLQSKIRAICEQLTDPSVSAPARSELITQRYTLQAALAECQALLAVTP